MAKKAKTNKETSNSPIHCCQKTKQDKVSGLSQISCSDFGLKKKKKTRVCSKEIP